MLLKDLQVGTTERSWFFENGVGLGRFAPACWVEKPGAERILHKFKARSTIDTPHLTPDVIEQPITSYRNTECLSRLSEYEFTGDAEKSAVSPLPIFLMTDLPNTSPPKENFQQ